MVGVFHGIFTIALHNVILCSHVELTHVISDLVSLVIVVIISVIVSVVAVAVVCTTAGTGVNIANWRQVPATTNPVSTLLPKSKLQIMNYFDCLI